MDELKGEIQQLIGFKEPMNLIAIRITWLEREKKIDQAMNLSLALGLFENAAKFQIKLNDIEGARKTTEQIRQASGLFSVAQVAKPVDVSFAFELVSRAIVQTFYESLESSKSTLSSGDHDMVMWAVGLAEAEGKAELLLERLASEIKSKEFLTSIFSLLSNRNKPLLALELGGKILPPYSLEELQGIFKDLRESSPYIRNTWESYESRLPEEQKGSFLQHCSTIFKFLPFCKTIKNLPTQMYRIITSALVDIASEDPSVQQQKQASVNEQVVRLLDTMIQKGEDVGSLELLLSSLSSDQRFDDVNRLGHHILNMAKRHQELENEFKDKRIRNKFEFDEQKLKETQEKNIPVANSMTLFIEPIRDHPRYDYAKVLKQVYRTLVDSGLRSLRRFVQIENPFATNDMEVDVGPKEGKEEKEAREQNYQQALSVLQDMGSRVFEFLLSVDSILGLAELLQDDCLRVSLSMLRGCFDLIRKARATAKGLEDVEERLAILESEIQALADEKQKPSAEQMQTRRDLRLEVALHEVIPAEFKRSMSSFDSLNFRVGKTLLMQATSGFIDVNKTERIPNDEVKQFLDLVLENVVSPRSLHDIASGTLTSEPIHLIYLVNQTIPRLQDLQTKWMDRAILEAEQGLLVEEQNNFQSKFKKDLDEPQLARLSEIQSRLSEMACDEAFSAINGSKVHARFFLNLQYSLVRLKIDSILRKRNEVVISIETTDIDRTDEQEERLKAELASLQEQLKTVFEGCISQLQLSSEFLDLMGFFERSSEPTLHQYPTYAESDLLLLLSLLERALGFNSELDEVREVELKKIDSKAIDEDARQLWDEVQNRQMLPTEQRDKHRSLKLEIRIFSQKFSGGEVPTLQNVFSVRKQMFQKLTTLLTRLSSGLRQGYRNEYKTLEEYLVQAATESTPALCARQRVKLGELQKFANSFAVLLGKVVKLVEANVEGPGTIKAIISTIAGSLSDCCEGESQEHSTAQLISLSSHLVKCLKELDDERQTKLPVFEAVEKLEREHAESVQLRKPFPKENLAKLKEHRRQIKIWNTDLSSKRLKADAIWDYLIQTADTICRSVLQRKEHLEQAALHWKNQIAQDDEMSDVGSKSETLPEFYLQLSKEEEVRLGKVSAYWDVLGAQFFEAIASPNHSKKLIHAIQADTDLTIQFAQSVFTKLTEARKTFEERKPLQEEYDALVAEKDELLASNKSLRVAEADRFDELSHMVFEWNNQPSFMRMNPSSIASLNRSVSGLLLEAIFAKISKLSTTVEQLELLIQSPPSDTASVVDVQYKLLSEGERAKLLETSSALLKGAIQLLNSQLRSCFPHMNDPSHLIHTAKMCTRAGQLESALMVCEHAFETISKLETKRENVASTFRRYFVQELEKFFASEFRLSVDKSMECVDIDDLLAEDLSKYEAKTKSYSRSSSRSSSALRFVPLTLSTAQMIQSSQPKYIESFYNSLVAIGQDLLPSTLHFQISRYSQVSTGDQNYPEDHGAPFVHSEFVKSLREVAAIMIGSVIEERNQLRNEVEEKRKFEQEVDEKDFKERMAGFNKRILELFERASESVDNVKDLNDLVLQIINLDSNDCNTNLRSDEFDLSLPICRTFLSKVQEEIKELREYEPKMLSFIKLLSEEEGLVSQRKELPQAQLEELRSLRSTFAEMFTFPPCHRLPLAQYNSLIFGLSQKLIGHLLEFRQLKENELEAMVRQPRLIRGRSMSEDEVKQEFTDNSLLQEKLNLQVVKLALDFVEDPDHLSQLAQRFQREKKMDSAIEIAGKAQDIYKLRLADRLRYEALMKQLIDGSRLPQGAGGGISEEIQEILTELESFRHQLTLPISNLRMTILSLADIMIEAARAEEREDVLEAQSILVFKMEMSVQKFEEVHTLVGDDRWESGIRDDLLTYVHGYDPTLPGSPITLVAKIELLVREKWWKEALEHRPVPTAADASSSIEVLKLLWFAVESNSPDDLGELVETIKAFTVKEFQKFNLSTMDSLLDLMQEGFPEEILDLYSKGSEIMMTNSSSKKYKMYVDFLVAMKGRLLAVGLVDEWNDFVKKVRKKEIRKKNLINMMDVHDL